jgi:hypothetical protein
MGQLLGYDFDEVQIKKGFYYPIRLGTIEDEQHVIREQLARVLRGEVSIPMTVTDFPLVVDDATVEAQVRKLLLPALEKAGVEVKELDSSSEGAISSGQIDLVRRETKKD